MDKVVFQKKVSKGTKFNQVYIPKNFNTLIEPGDIVEIRLIEKYIHLYYSDKRIKLSNFKVNLIKDIFLFLTRKGIKQIYIVGSFLYKVVGYNDLDVLIVTNEKYKNLDNELVNTFNQKFHLIFYTREELKKACMSDPIQRTMLNYSVSNQKIQLSNKKNLDKKLLNYYLMLPEDLLNVILPFVHFKKNIKRLIAIENFLKDEILDVIEINEKAENLLDFNLEDNEYPSKAQITKIRKIIKDKISLIKKKI